LREFGVQTVVKQESEPLVFSVTRKPAPKFMIVVRILYDQFKGKIEDYSLSISKQEP